IGLFDRILPCARILARRTALPNDIEVAQPSEPRPHLQPGRTRLAIDENPRGHVPLRLKPCANKKGAPDLPKRPLNRSRARSALRELEAAAGLRLAVLLAFDRAAVTGQEADLLEHRTQGRLEIG